MHLVLSFTQWTHTSSFYDTVGLYIFIYLHSEHHSRHLLFTACPASVPPLLVQWAHTSSFYDTVGLYPSFTYKVGTTLAIYCTQTFQPQFLPYLHSGPIPPHFMTQWAYTLIFLHSGHHPRHLLYTDCPTSVPPLLVQWAILLIL